MERSVVLIKPDGVRKKVVGEVISRFEKAGLTLVALKLFQLTDALLDTWYAHHKDKPFFPQLKIFMMQTPVVAMLWQGENAVSVIRELCGPTDSTKAAKGTIRGDFGDSIQENIVHASDSVETAEREANLLFQPTEIYSL